MALVHDALGQDGDMDHGWAYSNESAFLPAKRPAASVSYMVIRQRATDAPHKSWQSLQQGSLVQSLYYHVTACTVRRESILPPRAVCKTTHSSLVDLAGISGVGFGGRN